MNDIEKFLIENKDLFICATDCIDKIKNPHIKSFMVTRIPSEEELDNIINDDISNGYNVSVDLYKETSYWDTIIEAIENFRNKKWY